MPAMPVMDAVVHILEDEGTDVIFGIPGAGILPFYSSLRKSRRIRHFLARHEEGAIHAADGYARTTGKVGLCACTSGPAGTNFVTGLYTAQVDSIPIIAITGQNVRALLGKEAFQAVDIAEIVKPVVKKSWCVTDPAALPGIFREAYRVAREGRPGPVLIDLPLDVQQAEAEYDPAADRALPVAPVTPDPAAVRRAVEMVLAAEHPVLLIGGGVIVAEAWDEAVALAEYLQLPVVTSLMGKGAIRSDHPLYAGQVGIQCNTPAGNRTFLDSDLVIGVGCRFSDRHTGVLDVYRGDRKFIHIDIEPAQIGRIFEPDLGIVSDAKLALQALLDAARAVTPAREPAARVRELPVLRDRLARPWDFNQQPVKPQRVFKEIHEFFDEDTMFVTCIGLNQIWSSQYQHIMKPRHYIIPGGAGPLGWDLPAAIGAKVAHPDRQVVDIVGDFGLGFCGQEMAMACHYNIPVLVVVINNGYLSLIRQAEKYQYDMNYEVVTWYGGRLMDFVQWARSFGAYAERVEEARDIKAAFRRAIDSRLPALVEIIVDRESDASMGPAIDAVREFEPLPLRAPAPAVT